MNFSIISAKAYPDKSELLRFYKSIYPNRSKLPDYFWDWRYHGSYNDSNIPFLAVDGAKIIGHAGVIPMQLRINDEIQNVGWFNDFKILEEYRNQKVGRKLTEKWMQHLQTGIAFSNDQSFRILKKYGWEESLAINFHTIFINPLNHPKIKSKVPNFFASIGNYLYGKIFIRNVEPIIPKKLTDKTPFIESESDVIIRDKSFWDWRVYSSPNAENYYTVEAEGSKILFKAANDSYGNYIDILYVENFHNIDFVAKQVAKIVQYGKSMDYDFVRIIAPSSELSKTLKTKFKSAVTHPRFAFYSQNNEIFEKMKNIKWNWQLLDCDLEKFVNGL